VERNIAVLRGANRFAIRFTQIASVNKTTGTITVRPGFGMSRSSNGVNMVLVPAEVPVVLDDTEFVDRLKNERDGWVACDATWEFLRTVGLEVQFKTVQMACRED